MNWFQITHLIVTIVLLLLILTQNRGVGLSATFGGSGEFYGQKRGPEKLIHNATITFSIIFVGLSIAYLYI